MMSKKHKVAFEISTAAPNGVDIAIGYPTKVGEEDWFCPYKIGSSQDSFNDDARNGDAVSCITDLLPILRGKLENSDTDQCINNNPLWVSFPHRIHASLFDYHGKQYIDSVNSDEYIDKIMSKFQKNRKVHSDIHTHQKTSKFNKSEIWFEDENYFSDHNLPISYKFSTPKRKNNSYENIVELKIGYNIIRIENTAPDPFQVIVTGISATRKYLHNKINLDYELDKFSIDMVFPNFVPLHYTPLEILYCEQMCKIKQASICNKMEEYNKRD